MKDLYEIAKRIIDIDIYGARDNDLTPESLSEDLNDIETCHETIEYLLNIIEEMQQ